MEIVNVIGAFAGGVGGGLYAAQVIKSKISKIEQYINLQEKALVLLNDHFSGISRTIEKLIAENEHRKAQIEQNALIVSKELDKINNRINSIPRRKK
jgi:hypothetical protein